MKCSNIDTFLASGSKPYEGEAERSGKREYWQRSTKHYQRSNDYRAKVSEVHKSGHCQTFC